jgi:hypothetical protein
MLITILGVVANECLAGMRGIVRIQPDLALLKRGAVKVHGNGRDCLARIADFVVSHVVIDKTNFGSI